LNLLINLENKHPSTFDNFQDDDIEFKGNSGSQNQVSIVQSNILGRYGGLY